MITLVRSSHYAFDGGACSLPRPLCGRRASNGSHAPLEVEMLKFDYDAFYEAVTEAGNDENPPATAEEFVKDGDEAFRQLMPTKFCACGADFLNRRPAQDSKLHKHMLSCNFCRRLTKLFYLTYISESERLTLLPLVYPDAKTRPAPKDCFSFFDSDENISEDCYGIAHVLVFTRLQKEIKNHRDKCARCAAVIGFFQKMEMPKLK